MSPARAQAIADSFDLRDLPADFYANPYPVYDVLRTQSPIKRMPDRSYFLTRHADLVAVYRDALTFSSDKKVDEVIGNLLGVPHANRGPAQFGNPNVLNLARGDERLGEPANRHLAFGYGIHQCAGLSLARMEGRIAIGRFLMRFPHYQLTVAPSRGGRARFRGFLQAPFSIG